MVSHLFRALDNPKINTEQFRIRKIHNLITKISNHVGIMPSFSSLARGLDEIAPNTSVSHTYIHA